MFQIAIDPGKMCGVASLFTYNSILSVEELTPYETVRWVEMRLAQWMNDISEVDVVAERYTMTNQHHTQQPEALEVIGALRYVTQKHHVNFTLQSRSVKAKVTNEMLRELDWWNPTPGGHANDATRHLIVRMLTLNPRSDVAMRPSYGKMDSIKK